MLEPCYSSLIIAWQQGLTTMKPCTSTVNHCHWMAPSVKSVEPVVAKDMVIRKPRYHCRTAATQAQSAPWRLFNSLSFCRAIEGNTFCGQIGSKSFSV